MSEPKEPAVCRPAQCSEEMHPFGKPAGSYEARVNPLEYCEIPYRSLVPKRVEGLVLSGRCISCEQAPFQSARSMAPAMAVGHASGCAAALAAVHGVPPRNLDIKLLQKLLLGQKAELRI